MEIEQSDTLQQRRRRLLYRATHRGTYENDLMIGGYAHAHLAAMDEAALDAFEAVMEHPDAELADWLTGRVAIPPAVDTPMLRDIRDQAAISARTKQGR